jgi:oligosaccharide repeat unit polymerase
LSLKPAPFLAAVLGLAAAAAVYYAEFREGIPFLEYLFRSASEADLHRFGKGSRWQLLGHGIFVAGLLLFYHGLVAHERRARVLLITLSSLPVVYGLLKASKSDIFLPLLEYLAIYYYFKRSSAGSWRVAPVVASVVIAVATMMLLSTLRLWGISATGTLSYAEVTGFDLAQQLPFPINEILATLYGYSALNFQNLSNYMHDAPETFRLGTSMFRPFLSILAQGDIADAMIPDRAQWHYVSEAATVGTFLRDLYMEGGTMNCLLGAGIYALLVNFIYLRFRLKGSVVWLFVYVVFLFPWAWIFFQNAFAVLQFYVDAFYVIAIYLGTALLRVAALRQRIGSPDVPADQRSYP